MYKQTQITELLDQLLFLTGDDAQEIVEQFEGYPKEAVEKLIVILKEAVKEQQSMLEKEIEYNEEFARGFQEMLKETFTEIREAYEKGEELEASVLLEEA